MHLYWRRIFGPVVTLGTIAAAVAFGGNVVLLDLMPPMLVLLAAISAAAGGIRSGCVAAAIAIGAAAKAAPAPIAEQLPQLAILAVALFVTAAVVGRLRSGIRTMLKRESDQHVTAERLRAALDCMDIGIVLLDADTRAAFINRAFRSYFKLPDAKAATRPPIIALMYHGRDSGAFDVPDHEIDSYIAMRTDLIRAGDATPLTIALRDGPVLRFACTALPDGGRMLSYTPVATATRAGDPPGMHAYYRALRAGAAPMTDALRAAE